MLILSTNHPLPPLSSSPSMESSPSPPSASWSIYGRSEITQRYEILGRIGSGVYSDVYRGRRSSDGLAVALKEVHDYQSAAREIEALQTLRGSPNVVDLVEYFWREGDDAVLVLEFLPVDLASVVADANRSEGRRIPTSEIKRWMLQILQGVDTCHRNRVVHRDLKPSNLLVSAEGVLKLADFGQARILEETRSIPQDDEHILRNEASLLQQVNQRLNETEVQELQGPGPSCEDDYLQELDVIKGKYAMVDTNEDPSLQDGNASCLATCSSTGEILDEDAADFSEYESGGLTSCVGTRWFRAPELLYGSTNYGQGVDLWSLGCVFAELLSLETLFPGSSDIDQFSKIINVLGDLNEETFPGCSKLPDYSKVFFSRVESPIGLQGRLPDRTPEEVDLVRRLVCYDPASRATAMELLQDEYFCQEPLPVPVNELKVPSVKDGNDEWDDYNDWRSESEFEEFQRMDPMINHKAFF